MEYVVVQKLSAAPLYREELARFATLAAEMQQADLPPAPAAPAP